MDYIIEKLLILPGILIGLSFHEYAHAKVAYMLGDPTAKNMGRVSLNPAVHFSVPGFLCLLLVGFGWGKPVMVNSFNFRNRRRDEFLVSASGITMNFIMAITFAGLLKLIFILLGAQINSEMGQIATTMIVGIISINLSLMIFNLIPVPPLDGFNMLTEIFNIRNTKLFNSLYNYGPLILIALIVLNVTDLILSPAIGFFYTFIMSIFF